MQDIHCWQINNILYVPFVKRFYQVDHVFLRTETLHGMRTKIVFLPKEPQVQFVITVTS